MGLTGHLTRWQLLAQKLAPSSWRGESVNQPKPAILQLPDEVTEKLFSYLTPLSRARLALTCKRLYSLSGSAVKHPDFRFPRLPADSKPFENLLGILSPRNDLLLSLQNGRWLFCAKCVKLHPRSEFPFRHIRDNPRERYCMRHAGIVDLCPCNSITYRDKIHIAQKLHEIETWSTDDFVASLGSLVGGIGLNKVSINSTSGKRCLVHKCKVTSGSRADVAIRVVFTLSRDGNLRVRTQYTIRGFSREKRHFKENMRLWACPHMDLLSWLYTDGSVQSLSCLACQTRGVATPKSPRLPIIVTIRKNLGKINRWPADERWALQCRPTVLALMSSRRR